MKMSQRYRQCLLRCDMYRILSLGLDAPFEKNRREIHGILQDFVQGPDLPGLLPALRRCFRKLLSAVKKMDTAQWENEYNALFATKVLCPPSEGSYHLAERGPVLGDVSAFYKAFELNFLVKEGPPDHIKMELAFLSYLSLKEAYAVENGMLQESEITAQAQKSFLKDHLGRWGESFALRLAQNSSLPFYKELASALCQWLHIENKFFDISPAGLPLTLPAADDVKWACPR